MLGYIVSPNSKLYYQFCEDFYLSPNLWKRITRIQDLRGRESKGYNIFIICSSFIDWEWTSLLSSPEFNLFTGEAKTIVKPIIGKWT